MNADEQAITTVLTLYRDALSRSDVSGVVALYAPDAVLMAPENPPAVGVDAIRQAYAGMAGSVAIEIQFTIAELRQLTPEWAFARTTSAGTITIQATGAVVPEANQELFLFQKLGGDWKIARYSFSITQPTQP